MNYPRMSEKQRIEIATALEMLYDSDSPFSMKYSAMSEWLMGRRKWPKKNEFEEKED